MVPDRILNDTIQFSDLKSNQDIFNQINTWLLNSAGKVFHIYHIYYKIIK